jgi:hypothetical protein
MIIIVCVPCLFAIRVMPTSVTESMSIQEVDQLVGRNSDLWPDRYICPNCGRPARGMLERDADPRVLHAMTLRDLTPHEAYSVFNGFGLPEEQLCSLEIVRKVLLGSPVRKVIGSDVRGASRTIIDVMELWDGTKIYFGSGAEGAVIYRIAAPRSLTEKVLTE